MSSRRNPPLGLRTDFVRHGRPRPAPDQILLVHALSAASLSYFVKTGRCESSEEENALADRVYEAASLTDRLGQPFTCATASVAFQFKDSDLNAGYAEGHDIFLVIDINRVAGRTFVFNGGVASLGQALNKGLNRDRILSIPCIEPRLYEKLVELTKNNLRSSFAEPRKRGTFEARIFGGITAGDVMRIHLREDASDQELKDADQLFRLSITERRAILAELAEYDQEIGI